MKTKIERIAAKARSDKHQRFTSLAHHITPTLLWECLNEIPYDTSVGIDKINLKQAKSTFSDWSAEVLKQIHQGGYKPPTARRVYIPKPGRSEKRPLNIPTIIDRTVQRAVSKILTCIYEADFLPSSFGGRPQVGAHHAIATLRNAIECQNITWLYEVDLKSFFCSLNHGWIEQFIDLRVGDPRIVRLIKRWIRTGHMEDGKRVPATEGTAQGGPISVLLSNVYLHYALDLWVEKVVKPRLKGRVYYIRYLDDFVLGFQLEEDAKRFEKALPNRLARFSLEIQPTKTRLIPFGRWALKHAERTSTRMQTFYFLGFTFYNNRNRKGRYVLGMKTERSRFKRSCAKIKEITRLNRHKPLQEQIYRINSFLLGTYHYYGVTGNSEALQRLHYYATRQWRKALSSRSQSGRLNWDKFRKILSIFPLRRPKIYMPHQKLADMVLL